MSGRAGLLSSTHKNLGAPGLRSLRHLLPLLLFTPSVVGYVRSIYMENAVRQHTPWKIGLSARGLNESGQQRENHTFGGRSWH